MQTTSQRVGLIGSNGSMPAPLKAAESMDDCVTHEVKELGVHMYAVLWLHSTAQHRALVCVCVCAGVA